MARACRRALERGAGRIVAPLEELDVTVVDGVAIERVASPDTFDNVNTREEFVAATDKLAGE